MRNAMSPFEGPANLSFNERAISVVVGLGLAAAAAKPRPNPLLNIAALLGGGYLAYRGAVGHCPVKAAIESSGGMDRIAESMGMGSGNPAGSGGMVGGSSVGGGGMGSGRLTGASGV
jgi:uncharacterized membrane protein